jgi:hypothetical protein
LVDQILEQEFKDGTFFLKFAGGREIRQRAAEVSANPAAAIKLATGPR